MPILISTPGKTGPETARLFDEYRNLIDLEKWLDQLSLVKI
jgi:hypothetical protein